MGKYYLIHFGIGNVGKTLVSQLFASQKRLKQVYSVDLQYCGMFGSRGGFFKQSGFSESEVKKNITSLATPKIINPLDFLKKLSQGW